MRTPPGSEIPAPPFPRELSWVNVATLRMDKQRHQPVLVEFWDFCRVNSLRTLPYLKAWHERYAEAGLRVIQIHCPGYEPSKDEDAVRAAVARLGIEHPVLLDPQFEAWDWYDAPGWPSRYLFAPGRQLLFEYHHGEGGYLETEEAIRELLDRDDLPEPVGLLRPEDDPEALLVVPTPEQAGAYSGPYEAGGVWAVLSGEGTVTANGVEVRVEHPGCYGLVEHPVHTQGVLELEVGPGVVCHATAFTAGLAAEGSAPSS